MSEDSFLNTYDANGNNLKNPVSYWEVHKKGLWHKGVHVWAINEYNEFLIQKRSMKVHTHKGLYECAAGGHVDGDDTSAQAALHELREETGIVVDESRLEFIGTVVDTFAVPMQGIENNEFDDIYLVRIKKNEVQEHHNEFEIESLSWMPKDEYLERGVAGDPALAPRKHEYELLQEYLN